MTKEQAKEIWRLRKQDPHSDSVIEDTQILIGTCEDMCPIDERVERESLGDLNPFEITPESLGSSFPRVKHEWAVKKYVRAGFTGAARRPDLIRPPFVLQNTFRYLVSQVMSRDDVPLLSRYQLIRDRVRAISQDFTLQSVTTERSAVEIIMAIYEQSARFFILCAHLLCEEPQANYDHALNIDMISKLFISLKGFYDQGHHSENEAEIRSYDLILSLQVPDSSDHSREYSAFQAVLDLQLLPVHLIRSPHIQLAILIITALVTVDYASFFALLSVAGYLHGCLMSLHFNTIRKSAFHQLVIACKGTISCATILELFCFEDEAELLSFCHHHRLTITPGDDSSNSSSRLNLNARSDLDFTKLLSTRRISHRIIERKRRWPLTSIVEFGGSSYII